MREKQGYLNSQAKKYGIDDRDYYDDEGNANDRDKNQDIIKAMNSDYDLRQSMQYGRDSGNKYFEKVGNNISNINDAYNAGTAVDKYGKKTLGQKNTSSSNDYAAISHSLFNDSRDAFSQGITDKSDAKYATADKLNALQDKIQERATSAEPVEISSTLTNAQDNSADFQDDLKNQGSNIFGAIGSGNDLEQATDEAMSSEASGDGNDYKNKYSSNVKGGLKLSGIETRGPKSCLLYTSDAADE